MSEDQVITNAASRPSHLRTWIAMAALGAVAVLILLLVPPEKTLGDIIRAVFLHGALVQVGLIAFGAAGILGIAFLITRNDTIYRWCLAVQTTAVIVWVAYSLSSTVTTRLAWGEWIAWDEPRVRASIHVLWFSLVCLVLVLWVNQRIFTAVANVIVAGAVWFLIKGAGLLRHPFDPIGTSNSSFYQAIYLVLVAVILAMAVLLARWLHTRREFR
jgi:hypothetical protein